MWWKVCILWGVLGSKHSPTGLRVQFRAGSPGTTSVSARTTPRRCRRPSICIHRSKIRLDGGYWTRRERRAVASFVYGSCPFSQASGRLRAPLYDPATAQRRRRDPIRCAPPTPRPVLILIFPAHSLCKLPDVEFPLPSLLRSIDRMLLRSFLLWDGLAWMLHSPSLRVF